MIESMFKKLYPKMDLTILDPKMDLTILDPKMDLTILLWSSRAV